MADNVAITPGTGATVAADDIAGVLHQRVKLSVGADGSAADLSFGTKADASSLPVSQSTEDKAALAALAAKLPAALGSLADAASLAVTQSTEDKAVLSALSAKLPASVGSKADSASLAVTQSTEDKAVLAAMSAKLTASLGAKTAATSYSVVQAIDAVLNPTANFTRPADTTAYASGDLVANSTTAGSVVAMTLTVARVAAGSLMIRRLKLGKSTTSVTNASFRVHLFRAAPSTVTNGDNGAFSVSGRADYVGAYDVTVDRAFTDGAVGFGLPVVGSDMTVALASGTSLFALIEARAAYTPGNAEVFYLTLDTIQG